MKHFIRTLPYFFIIWPFIWEFATPKDIYFKTVSENVRDVKVEYYTCQEGCGTAKVHMTGVYYDKYNIEHKVDIDEHTSNNKDYIASKFKQGIYVEERIGISIPSWVLFAITLFFWFFMIPLVAFAECFSEEFLTLFPFFFFIDFDWDDYSTLHALCNKIINFFGYE